MLVDVGAELEERIFITYGTGHRIEDVKSLDYLGSYQVDEENFIFHVFEKRK